MLVRFIGAALIGWTVVEFSLYYVICLHNQTPLKIVPCVIRSLPLLAGVAVLLKSKSIAHWVSEKLDQ